jgi:pyruvate kinase
VNDDVRGGFVFCPAAVHEAETHRLVEDGDLVAITAGVPLGVSGTTNLMKVERIGK